MVLIVETIQISWCAALDTRDNPLTLSTTIEGNSFGGASMDDDCGVIPSPLDDTGETFPSGKVRGNVCYSVPTNQLDGATIRVEETFSFEDIPRVLRAPVDEQLASKARTRSVLAMWSTTSARHARRGARSCWPRMSRLWSAIRNCRVSRNYPCKREDVAMNGDGYNVRVRWDCGKHVHPLCLQVPQEVHPHLQCPSGEPAGHGHGERGCRIPPDLRERVRRKLRDELEECHRRGYVLITG